MHVQSNRTRTRVHLYCTHSISDQYHKTVVGKHARLVSVEFPITVTFFYGGGVKLAVVHYLL